MGLMLPIMLFPRLKTGRLDALSTSSASWLALLQDRSQAGGAYFDRLSPKPEGGQEFDLDCAASNETDHLAAMLTGLEEQSSCALGSQSSIPGNLQV